jgi:maltooligosyltrehalose trehalohydrolase
MPDPQAESTFLQSRLNHEIHTRDQHKVLWSFYRELIRLRKTLPALRELDKVSVEVTGCEADNCLTIRRTLQEDEVVLILNFSDRRADSLAAVPPGHWQKCMDSAEAQWSGPGSSIPSEFTWPDEFQLAIEPKSFCLLNRLPVAPSESPATPKRLSAIGLPR